jgi:hypothetical protein
MAFSLPGEPDGDPARQDKFDALANAMPGIGGRTVEIRYAGPTNVTWPGGSPFSNIMSIPHGLGKIAITVVATLVSGGPAGFCAVATDSYTTTTFNVRLGTVDGSSPANTTVSTVTWLAIG